MLADYQKQVDDLLQPYATPYWSPLSEFAQLAEEVGEIGDTLFALICIANSEGIDLDAAFTKFLHKLESRDKERFEKKAV